MRLWLSSIVVIALLGALAWFVPQKRRELVRAVTTYDAVATDPTAMPGGSGPPLGKAARTRVVLIDGLAAPIAKTLPHWSAACRRGTSLDVAVGFPTVSLPVEVALWTGLTQQQTGIVFRSGKPLVPPLDKRGIPAQVAGSIAIAEDHGYIVRSLGFAQTSPAATSNPAQDADEEAWKTQWETAALTAVKSAAPLAFIHILRVDTAGHKHGMDAAYVTAAKEADEILGRLMAADPAARWFLLSDHGHLPTGGHGGEEREIRHVQHCIIGPGIGVTRGGPVHIVDVARALADSTGATLDTAARGRPLAGAIANPLTPDQDVPHVALGFGALAIFILG